MLNIKRTIPPAAASLDPKNLVYGLAGMILPRKYIAEVESDLRAYFGVKHVFLVSSGKAALALILDALHALEPERQKVIIPAYTCFSVPSAVVKSGLEISLCDLGAGTFDYDFDLLPGAVREDTLCIIANHLFGIPADTDKIRIICKERNIFVVEDAAQAMGCRVNGSPLGTIGDVGFYSLGRGKNITCGSGGVIVTNDDRIAAEIEKKYCALDSPGLIETVAIFFKALILMIFIQPSLYWLPAGLPFLQLGKTFYDPTFPVKKLSGLQAGLLKRWQERLDRSNQARVENSRYFTERSGLTRESFPLLRMPVILESREERDLIYTVARNRGLGVSLMYPTPINEIEEIKVQFTGRIYPLSKSVAERLIALPTHHLLNRTDKKEIVQLFSSRDASVVCQTAATGS